MNILNLHESDGFDPDDFDDLENEVSEVEESGLSKFFLKSMLTVFAVIGIAYGANLALNVNAGNKAEFGQGVTVFGPVCDTNGGITVTPYTGFFNQSGSGKFALDSIILENVDAACVGKDFILQVFSNSDANALTISETATSPGVYQGFASVRFYFQDSATVTMMSNQYTDIELLTDIDAGSTEFANNQSSFQLTFDPDTYANFADAKDVFKITLQTARHVAGATS
jgi:hypothetical protein